ncbi:MDR family MFS transporter [Paenibacillus ehimensis]|uniref:MDR family MFS transporter n=1 Tax=Paenibacillus ehimensis TaxID=79264 RepID=UPI00046F4336|nr:MDR family MFS transporter [Paenibacillus ehimensis]MEC0209915.1 MDR family MFS transporter [Paenibacillus ehimensis]
MSTDKSNGSRLGFVVAGLLLGILMAAMDNTIVATAMGTIVAELGGLDKFVWVTSAYMVAEMAGMPIFGKLSDMYGRKRFFVFGLIVFLLGSVLCGTASSITELSIYRAIQGIGGGALMPIAFTIIFDVFPAEKRGKMSGLFGAVFGLSSIFGPLLGAYITDYIGWKWIFYVNVPIGLLALLFIVLCYRESPVHAKQRIDWWGAVTLVGAIVCLMFALELGGGTYPWTSGTILGLFAGFVVLFGVFLFAETRAREPIISFAMFQNRLFASSNLVGLFYGAAFIVATVYIPIFVQGVFGGSATNSGLILLPMMLGTVVTAQLGGFLAGSGKMSYRGVMLIFSILFAVSILLLATLTPDTPRYLVTLFMILVGLGTGASFSVLGMSAIHGFEAKQRGSASSTMSFVRSLGMTIGITVYGIIQRNDLESSLADTFGGAGAPQGISLKDPRDLLSPAARSAIPAPVLDKITAALSTSISHTFLWALIPAALTILCVLWMSREKMHISREPREVASEQAASHT